MKKRQSNIELLRIFAMLIITFNHVHTMTGADEIINTMEFFSPNALISLFFLNGGKVGSNLFILGGGVFLIHQKEFSLKNAMKIWLITFFYSIVLNVVDVVVFHKAFTFQECLKMCLPVTGGYYWFSRSYILLIFMLPIIIKFMRNSRWNDTVFVLWTLLLIISTLFLNGAIFKNRWLHLFFIIIGKGPFVFAYLIAMLVYVNDKGILQKVQSKHGLIIALITWMLMWIVEVVLLRQGIDTNSRFLIDNYSAIRDLPSILCILCSLGFFIWFYKMEVKQSNIINRIASFVFGVYLVQCHSRIIWEGLYDFQEILVGSTVLYILMAMSVVILFFAIGLGMEWIRQNIFGNLEKKILTSKSMVYIDDSFKRIYVKIVALINCNINCK